MHACSLSLQALVLFISTCGALAAVQAGCAALRIWCCQRDGAWLRMGWGVGGGHRVRGRGRGDAENMQRGSADEIRGRKGKRGADGRAASEGEGRGGTTDGDEGEGEETRRAWLILHQTCPLFSSVCPSSSPPPPPTLLYLDKNCEVVRFHPASQAHSDGFQSPNVSAAQDDQMFAHTLPNSGRAQNLFVSECISKHLLEQTLRLPASRFLRHRSPAEGAVIEPSRCQDRRPRLILTCAASSGHTLVGCCRRGVNRASDRGQRNVIN